MSLVQIKDNVNLVRDTYSKAILNTDRTGLNDYLMKREIAKKQTAIQKETQERLGIIERDMSEIKELIKEIAVLRGK